MMATYLKTISSFSRNARLLLFTSALIGFAYMGIYVMLFNLYLLRLGYEPKFIGLVNAAAQLGFALFSLPSGALGKRWGSRRMSITGLSIAILGLGLLPLVEMLPLTWQSTWLMTTYIIVWLGGGLYLVNMLPLMMAATSPTERDQVFSTRQAIIPLAGFAGSLVGGFLPGFLAKLLGSTLGQPTPYRLALFFGAGLLVPAVLALLVTDDVASTSVVVGQMKTSSKMTGTLPIGLMTFMALVVFLLVAGNSTARIFFNLYLDDGLELPTFWIGMLVAIGNLLGGTIALLTPLAIARWGKGRTISVGIYGLALSLLPLALVAHWGAAGFGFVGVTALFNFTMPALTVCQQEIVPPQWRSTMAGAVSMATGLSTAATAFGGGYLITAFGYQSLFLMGAGLAAIGATLFWGYTWVPRWVLIRRPA
jgi:MFS family permease